MDQITRDYKAVPELCKDCQHFRLEHTGTKETGYYCALPDKALDSNCKSFERNHELELFYGMLKQDLLESFVGKTNHE